MPAVGGSVESVTLNGRTFAVPADTDISVKLGGDENEVAANGNSTSRLLKTKAPWSIDGLIVSADDDKADHEFLQGLADGNDFIAVSITYANGKVYQGNGQIVGEIQRSTANATATCNLMGTGILTQQ